MPAKLTTGKFISQSKAVHGEKYDYSLVEYVNSKKKVKIKCPIHGIFLQKPNNHKDSGNGCPDCGYEDASKKLSMGRRNFVDRANDVHNGFYDYSLVEYKNNRHGVDIICPIHGLFNQAPDGHIGRGYGCPKCQPQKISESNRLSRQEVISRAKKIHGNKYSYDNTVYNLINEKIEIACSKHGIFKQDAHDHVNKGRGCPDCANDKRINNFGYGKWVQRASSSKGYDSYKVYVIKCFDRDTEEVFYKIGKTFRTLVERFKDLPYSYKVIKLISSHSGRDICEIERALQKKCKHFYYKPVIGFGGCTECFSSIDPIK